MQLRRGEGELRRLTADLGERGEPGPAVEGAVLDALGHHHSGGLLEPDGELRGRIVEPFHHRTQRVGQFRTVPYGEFHCLVEVLAAQRQVRPVHAERAEQFGDRVVGVGGQIRHEPGQPQYLGPEDPVRHRALGGPRHGRPVDPQAVPQLGVQPVEHRLAGRIDEQPIQRGERLVPGGPRAGPGRRELLVPLDDLLDQHIAVVGELGQVVEVAARVRQPVRMVDPQAVHPVVLDPLLHLRMGHLEDLGQLHANAGQRVDREEPAVVQLRVRPAVIHQLVVLAGMDLSRGAFAGALGDREPVVVVVQLAALDAQRIELVVPVAQDREPELAVPRVPVDVERGGVLGIPAVGQHIPPPHRQRRGPDADVVGHDVDQHAEAGRPGSLRHLGQRPVTAAAVVDLAVVDDVVAVFGSRLGRQHGREVQPVDADRPQVRDQRRGIRQVPFGGDLQPVGRQRNPGPRRGGCVPRLPRHRLPGGAVRCRRLSRLGR